MAVMKYLLRDHFSGKENCISENILHLEIPSVLCSYLLRRVPLGAFASREKPIRYSRSPTKTHFPYSYQLHFIRSFVYFQV